MVTADVTETSSAIMNNCTRPENPETNLFISDGRESLHQYTKILLCGILQCLLSIIYENEEEMINFVDKCCQGFYEFKNRCVPIICSKCVHGYCDEENMKCQCYSGFFGDFCETECDPMRWGVNCQFNCTCARGTCNPQTGYCICPSGWIGKRCELECPDGHYGEQCNKLCNCHQFGGGKCNGTTGECIRTISDYNGDDEQIQVKSDIEIVNNLLSKGLSNPELRKHPVLDKYYTFDYYTTQSSSPNLITTIKSTSYEKSEGKGHLEVPSVYESTSSTSRSTVKAEVDTTMSHTTSTSSTSNDLFKQKQQVMKSDKIKIEPKGKVSDGHIVGTTTILNHYQEGAKKAPEEKWVNNDEEGLIQRDKKTPDANNLVFNVSTATGITVAIIIVAVAIVAVDRKKRIRRSKDGGNGKNGTSNNAKCTTGIQTVSVYTKSIFHTPLPELPVFKNPAFTTPVDTSTPEVTTTTFQTHVVCSMNFPGSANNTTKESSNRDYLYDHPPSTGSYRPASIPEPPPEIDANGVGVAAVATNEPVYDEIPCWGRPAPVTQLQMQPYSTSTEQASLYMNTCAKTRF